VVAGRYQIRGQLGEGGFGRVWKAYDRTLRREVVLKQILLPVASDKERARLVGRAVREARHAAVLGDHPHIVTVHDILIEQGAPWIVMQLITGGSLEQHLVAHGALPVARVVHIARDLVSALGAAHAAGIVHRDVKPSNVLLAEDRQALLTDFGIAIHPADTALTTTGTFLGSAEYTAPERMLGRDGQPAGDLFSLGVTLYQAVEGVSPFRRENPMGSLYAVVNDPLPAMVRAGALAPLITRLLDKDPDSRPTALQAAALLPGAGVVEAETKESTALATSQIPAIPPTAPRPPDPDARSSPRVWSNRRRAAAAVIIVFIAVGMSVALMWPGSNGSVNMVSGRTTPPLRVSSRSDSGKRPAPPDPCSGANQTVIKDFNLTALGPSNATDTPQPGEGWTNCSWQTYADGTIFVIIDYFYPSINAENPLVFVYSSTPKPISGLSRTTQYSDLSGSIGECGIWWPTSFGAADVVVEDSSGSQTIPCSIVTRFVTEAAPDLPK
jgi:serine/threonine protein kinase